jgi:hypothetical protein
MLEGVEYIPFNPDNPELALSRLLGYLGRRKKNRSLDFLQTPVFLISELIALRTIVVALC